MTEFVTKDSGERAHFDSGMQRDTEAGKPRFDLIVPEGVPFEAQFLTRVAGLLGRGAEKYAERNWEQANSEAEIARMKSSAFRHFMQWISGDVDEDHAAAVVFNLLAAETVRYKLDTATPGPNDYYPEEPLADWERELLGTLSTETPNPIGCLVTVTGDTAEWGHAFPAGTEVRVIADEGCDLKCEYLDGSDYWWVAEVDLA